MREFILRFPKMPVGTSQQKRYNSRTGIYFKDKKLQTLENEFIYALKPYAPLEPSDKPIKLFVSFAFDIIIGTIILLSPGNYILRTVM